MSEFKHLNKEQVDKLKGMRNASRILGRNVSTAEGLQAVLEALYERTTPPQETKSEVQKRVENLDENQVNDIADNFISIDKLQASNSSEKLNVDQVEQIELHQKQLEQLYESSAVTRENALQNELTEWHQKWLAEETNNMDLARDFPTITGVITDGVRLNEVSNVQELGEKLAGYNGNELGHILKHSQHLAELHSQEHVDTYQIQTTEDSLIQDYPGLGIVRTKFLGESLNADTLQKWGQNLPIEGLEVNLADSIRSVRTANISSLEQEQAIAKVVEGYARNSGIEHGEELISGALAVPLDEESLGKFVQATGAIAQESRAVESWHELEEEQIKSIKIPSEFTPTQTLAVKNQLNQNDIGAAADVAHSVISQKSSNLSQSVLPKLFQTAGQGQRI